MSTNRDTIIELRPPSPSSVLYMIYQKDGDGALSYEVENGSWATYWYGDSFELGGKHYFTGFAYQTPEKYGNDPEEEFPDPDAKVTITQATFYKDETNSQNPWVFQGNQHYVGEFGGYEKGSQVDTKRKPLRTETKDGRMVLAIPTWALESGTRVESFEMFLFNPHDLTKADDKRWEYLGSIAAGEDNSAACDEGETPIPCVKTHGSLSFATEADGLPTITITGSTEAGPARSSDRVEYHFDPEKRVYLAR